MNGLPSANRTTVSTTSAGSGPAIDSHIASMSSEEKARSDTEAARLLSRMEPDNAADLISEIDQDRRLPILERLPDVQKSKVRQLLSYSGDTAGGLMNPDFVSVPATATDAAGGGGRTNSDIAIVLAKEMESFLTGSAPLYPRPSIRATPLACRSWSLSVALPALRCASARRAAPVLQD